MKYTSFYLSICNFGHNANDITIFGELSNLGRKCDLTDYLLHCNAESGLANDTQDTSTLEWCVVLVDICITTSAIWEYIRLRSGSHYIRFYNRSFKHITWVILSNKTKRERLSTPTRHPWMVTHTTILGAWIIQQCPFFYCADMWRKNLTWIAPWICMGETTGGVLYCWLEDYHVYCRQRTWTKCT